MIREMMEKGMSIRLHEKACYNKSSALTTSWFIGIATADSIGFSHPVKCYCVLSLSGTTTNHSRYLRDSSLNSGG